MLRRWISVKDLGQAGDTIVEVLIAIAIISLVLTAAYATTNRNTIATQNNEEHIQAQHLVEAQIEALRAQNGINATGECFNGADEVGTCNAFTAAGSGATYTLKVEGPTGLVTPTDGTERTYTVTATWTSLGAQTDNNSNISMIYRLN